MVPVRLLHTHEIGEGLFPVGVPVIRAGAVEAGVDKDGKVLKSGHTVGLVNGGEQKSLGKVSSITLKSTTDLIYYCV